MASPIFVETPDWEAAKASVASGVPLIDVAKRLGIDYELLKKRAQRSGWSRPHLAIRKAKEAQRLVRAAVKEKREDGQDLSPSVPEGSKTQESDDKRMSGGLSVLEKSGTLILESAQKLAESGSLMGLKLLHGQMQAATDNPEQLAPLSSAKDIVTAINGMRKAAGLDKAEVNVGFNLFGGPMSQPGTRDVTVDIRDESGANLGEWSDER